MNRSKLAYVIGGACMGALIGAVYAAFVYDMIKRADDALNENLPDEPSYAELTQSPIDNHVPSEEWEPVRKESADTQRRAAKTRVTREEPKQDD
jgi:hypothetical protein